MEKVLYVLAFPGGQPAGLTRSFVDELAPKLVDVGAHRVQVNVADEAVAGATRLRMGMSGSPADAVLGVWVDSATDHLRAPIDDAIRAAVPDAQLSAYLVTESVPMHNTRFPAALGERTHGMAHLPFLRRPDGMSVEDWLAIWLGSHTQIAMDTQDTFAYVQHVVARVLVPGPVEWHAIVEECFPEAAMTDPRAFYDAVGDDERYARHQREMFESVQRFIDLSMIDVVPTSRYVCS